MITVTDKAATHIHQYSKSRGTAPSIRLSINKTGCSGYQYIIELAQVASTNDMVFTTNQVNVYVDKQSLPIVQGSQIDYTTDKLTSGLVINNPNEKQQCGCGLSFTV